VERWRSGVEVGEEGEERYITEIPPPACIHTEECLSEQYRIAQASVQLEQCTLFVHCAWLGGRGEVRGEEEKRVLYFIAGIDSPPSSLH
jgi:hypothetical protein